MEFNKDYSDDSLMGPQSSNEGAAVNPMAGADLVDFELPPYSGGSSSSGSEQAAQQPKQPSPAKRKSSSGSSTSAALLQLQQQQQLPSSSQNGAPAAAAATDLSAIRKLLVSGYSKFSHVFHWRNPIETGLFFALGNCIIVALTFFSIISVVAYTALTVILASALIRVYKTSMKMLNKSPETPFDNSWNKILSLNVTMSPDRLHGLVDSSHANLSASLVYFKQVLLVEDKIATLKFGVFLYLLTYIGAWFNGMTLITICFYALFSAPILYEKNKTKIDEYLNLATSQLASVTSLVTSKVSTLAFGGGGGSGGGPSTSAGESKKQK